MKINDHQKHSALWEIRRKIAYTIMNHSDCVLSWFWNQINNGILEGFKILIQSTKAKAKVTVPTRTLSI